MKVSFPVCGSAVRRRLTELLPPNWNLPNLGRIANLRTQELDSAKLLHWTGKRKPWLPNALYPERWRRYVPQACVATANRSAPWRRAPWPRVRLG